VVDEGRVARRRTAHLFIREPGRFGNVLVHQYAIVDDRIVLESVSRLVDLDSFVTEVSAWMTSLD
jgi:uncharacterized protein YutE (UPF0331/DUF86 family)